VSGPPYPREPLPGSNAIGSFQIGVSPIGDVPVLDSFDTIISQYANSPVVDSLIQSFQGAVDQTANIDAFFDLVWNIDSAEGWGLDVWGRIVGVTRVLNIEIGEYFGMQGPAGASGAPYNIAPFYNGAPLTTNFSLTDSAFRQLIFAKALANISDGSIPSINQILLLLFPGRGNCYVTDGLDMTMTYTFLFKLSPVEAAIIGQSGILPKPVGVQAAVVQIY